MYIYCIRGAIEFELGKLCITILYSAPMNLGPVQVYVGGSRSLPGRLCKAYTTQWLRRS